MSFGTINVAGYNGTINNLTVNGTLTSSSIAIPGAVSLDQIALNGSTSGTATILPAATTTSYSMTLPAAQGAANTVLQNNGSGTLSWAAGSAAGWQTAGNTASSGALKIGVNSGTSTVGIYSGGNEAISIDNASNTTFYGSVNATTGALTSGESSLANGALQLYNLTNANTVGIQSPNSVTTSYNINLPAAQGSAGSSLQNDGSGNLSWVAPGAAMFQPFPLCLASSTITAGGTQTCYFVPIWNVRECSVSNIMVGVQLTSTPTTYGNFAAAVFTSTATAVTNAGGKGYYYQPNAITALSANYTFTNVSNSLVVSYMTLSGSSITLSANTLYYVAILGQSTVLPVYANTDAYIPDVWTLSSQSTMPSSGSGASLNTVSPWVAIF